MFWVLLFAHSTNSCYGSCVQWVCPSQCALQSHIIVCTTDTVFGSSSNVVVWVCMLMCHFSHILLNRIVLSVFFFTCFWNGHHLCCIGIFILCQALKVTHIRIINLITWACCHLQILERSNKTSLSCLHARVSILCLVSYVLFPNYPLHIPTLLGCLVAFVKAATEPKW